MSSEREERRATMGIKYIPLVYVMAAVFGCSPKTNNPGVSAGEIVSATADSTFGWSASPARYEEREGKFLFHVYCAVCHGDGGGGDGFNAYNLDVKPHSLADSAYMAQVSENSLRQVIALGGRGVNKSVLMPPYGHTLSEVQIGYLIAYIRGFTGAAK